LTPQLLKAALTEALNELLAPIQVEFQASGEWQKIAELAYPPEKKVEKVKKNTKKGGDPAKLEAARAAKAAKAARAAQQAESGIEALKIDAETKAE
jgi:tyrosyl-tRNA synthetase